MNMKLHPQGCEFCNSTSNVGICRGYRSTEKPCTNCVCEACSPKIKGLHPLFRSVGSGRWQKQFNQAGSATSHPEWSAGSVACLLLAANHAHAKLNTNSDPPTTIGNTMPYPSVIAH
jgi:hypothetical protein